MYSKYGWKSWEAFEEESVALCGFCFKGPLLLVGRTDGEGMTRTVRVTV